MQFIQITSAVDWYFKHDSTVWNIAAFGLTGDGKVVGLVGAGTDGILKPVPTKTNGIYLHRRQLTPEEIEAADNSR